MPPLFRLRAVALDTLSSAVRALAIAAVLIGEPGLNAVAYAAVDQADPAGGGDLSADELEKLVAPIALYPDELLAITLPAATYPLDIVQAARVLERRETDPNAMPDESWDSSVLGLMNYPEVVELMNDDLNWTWKLGEAVANQQDDVMAAIQSFRAKVYEAGNLQSNDKVQVSRETEGAQQIVIIESASPEVIYVPQYQPTTVVVSQPSSYVYVYSEPRPYYYDPAAAFWTGLFVGAAIGFACSWGWRGGRVKYSNNVNVNVNRPGRPSTPRRPGAGIGGPGGGNWKPNPGRGRVGGRPGRGPGGSRPGAGIGRPGGGSGPGAGVGRPGGGSRPGAGVGRPGGGGSRPGAGVQRPGSSRPSSPRGVTSGSRSQPGSSMGRPSGGGMSRSHGSRGRASRGGFGGRGRGGGRRR